MSSTSSASGPTAGAPTKQDRPSSTAELTGHTDPLSMAAALTRHYGVVVLKLGGAGCVLATLGQPPVVIAAHPARATDTTGAGDAFCGAFMSRWLAGTPDSPAPALPITPGRLADLVGTAEFAARIAATVVTRFGARPV